MPKHRAAACSSALHPPAATLATNSAAVSANFFSTTEPIVVSRCIPQTVQGMGPKGKNGTKGSTAKGPPPIIQKDLLQRIHFSQQASIYLQSLADKAESSRGSDTLSEQSTRPRGLRSGDGDNNVLSSLARDQMRGSKRLIVHNQLKLDPSLKRTTCSSCHCVLVPGLTSRVRNRPAGNHINVTHHTCLHCSHTLTLPCPPTLIPSNTLDGPSRSSRRRRAAKGAKVVFFEKEGEGGHVLWRGQTKVDGWGEATESPTLNQTDAAA